VGIGSFAFHATLLYQAQLADELPMILAATYVFYLLLDIQPGPGRPLSVIVPLLVFDALFSWS
jgi:dihydroceramidase